MYCNSISHFKVSDSFAHFYNFAARLVPRNDLAFACSITANDCIIT
jgi:hypothetical protein